MFARILIAVLTILIAPELSAAGELVDHAGRAVKVPENPRRVVGLAPSITEMVFAVDRGDRLVGVTEFSDYPDAAKKIQSVGSYVSLDLEKIVSLNPDLCIAIKDGNPISVIRRLEEIGIPVYAVDPRDLDSVVEALRDIGVLLGAENQAGLVIKDMEDRMEKVREKISGTSYRPEVFFQIGVNPVVSAGRDTFINELITMAGGRNLAAGHRGYPRFSTEEVLSLDPEIIIVTSMNRQKAFDRVVEKWKQWKDLSAASNDRIYLVDSDLVDRPSPRLIKGLEELARLIHPNQFEETERK